MGEDCAITAGQSRSKHSGGPIEWPMSDREDTAENKVEMPSGHRPGN